MAIDNMYRRRRLGPPLGVRMALSIPPSVFFPTLGFLYMAFLDHPRRLRPALLYVFAPITALGSTKDIGLAAMLVLLGSALVSIAYGSASAAGGRARAARPIAPEA